MTTKTDVAELATAVTVAWLENAQTRAIAAEVPAFLESIFANVTGRQQPVVAPAEEAEVSDYAPAVSVRKSLASPDHILSMIDGKPYKALRRHLRGHGLTPDQYRERYNLKSDYPMVAASYSESRRAMAKQIGLGRKPGQRKDASAAPTQVAVAAVSAKPKRRAKVAAEPTAE